MLELPSLHNHLSSERLAPNEIIAIYKRPYTMFSWPAKYH